MFNSFLMTTVIGVAALSEEVFSMITLFLNAEEALALSYTCIHCYICLSRDNSALWRRYLETGTNASITVLFKVNLWLNALVPSPWEGRYSWLWLSNCEQRHVASDMSYVHV
ncbi:hypothetical protein FOZ61_005731 [Perkinsus olseni]|uniref:Uncharacterized protein n=1 Tax=Perkinsus olseni TaxID=32597 RepID=A0A7J6LG49_PEROL|nr:hypothetical protein FOZ61_005731 [Perkinsus olseni]